MGVGMPQRTEEGKRKEGLERRPQQGRKRNAGRRKRVIPICHPSREVGLVSPTVIHLDAAVRGTRVSVSLQPHCFSVPSFPVPVIFYLLSWAPLHATTPQPQLLFPGPISPHSHHWASPRPCVLASMISLMRPEPTLFLAASFTLYHVPHLRLSSLKARSLELMNTSFHSSLLSTEYCSTKPAREGCLAQVEQGRAWGT